MTDLRESVEAAIEREIGDEVGNVGITVAASAALRAVADAGFVIVPRQALEGLIGHTDWVAAEFDIHWAHLPDARSALSAALKEMG